jgi:3-hydroxyacyl-[acyl-carrier-protein] dehydratase
MHRVSLRIPADHPSFAGHFPSRPVLPAVVLLAQVLEAALDEPLLAARIGRAPRIGAAKFQSPVAPGSELQLQFDIDAKGVRFEVWRGDKLAASGMFESPEKAAP